MKHIFSLFVLLFISILGQGQHRAQKVDSLLNLIHKKFPNIGMSVGFIDQGQKYFFNYGKADKTLEKTVNEHSIYEIGSITKIFTANLVAQAAIEKLWSLDDYIDSYLPEDIMLSDSLKQRIKISDLASYQAGLPPLNLRKFVAENPEQPLSALDKNYIKQLFHDSVQRTDYGIYRYSNTNYILLGMMLEMLYQKSYATLVMTKITTPLGMERTLTEAGDMHNVTTAYNGLKKQQDFLLWNIFGPSGGLKSTPVDILTFLETILSHKDHIVVRANQLAEQLFYKDVIREVGLGYQIIKRDGHTIYVKRGDTVGQSSAFGYDKENNWGIVILLNHRNIDLSAGIFNELYKQALQ